MKLGLIGCPLGHSWSPEIHGYLKHVDYKLWPLEADELSGFFEARDFDGINVTIPYKTEVIRFLDEIDPDAENIQAVNTVVNRDGKLKGYNTDVMGLMWMIENHHINEAGGTAAILGTGGVSKAAAEACRLSGWKYYLTSRVKKPGCIDYDELYAMSDEISMIINATPVGMFPDEDVMPVDPGRFENLTDVVDIVANPVRTRLTFEAQLRGLNAYGGLEMLVAQAFKADELFYGEKMDAGLVGGCMSDINSRRQNIVLIGMPSSGKTTAGKLVADRLGMGFLDMDEEIVKRIGMPIADYFARYGEEAFRDVESEVCRYARSLEKTVISTGGGVIKRKENMVCLAHKGTIIWLDRDPDKLIPTDDRPLSSRKDDIYRLYEERKDLYKKYCDARISNNGEPGEAVNAIVSAL